MINLESAPKAGRILAYTPDRLVFGGYEMSDGRIRLQSGETFDAEGAYELHLFDADTEFRAIFEGGEWAISIMRAADEHEDEDHFTFTESQFVRERYWTGSAREKIVVNNHFSFGDEGFLRLDGYRLAMEADK